MSVIRKAEAAPLVEPLELPASVQTPSESLARREWMIALAVAVVAGLLRVALAENRGFWLDEYYTLRAAQMALPDLIRERLAAGHSPLYFIYAKWPLVFGSVDWVLRLSSAVMVSATVLCLTGLAGALGLRRCLVPLWVLAVFHPYWITVGTEYRYMMPLIAVTAGAAWAAVVFSRVWHWKPGACAAILVALMLWVHSSGQFAALGLLAFLLWESRARMGRWNLRAAARIWPVIAGIAGSGPLLYLVSSYKSESVGPVKFSVGDFIKNMCAVTFGDYNLWPNCLGFSDALVLGPQILLFALAIFYSRRMLLAMDNKRTWRFLAAFLLGVFVCQGLTTALVRDVQGPSRYLAVASIPLTLCLVVVWRVSFSPAKLFLLRGAIAFFILTQCAATAFDRGDLHREAILWIKANTNNEKVLVSSTAVNRFAFQHLGFPYPDQVIRLWAPGRKQNPAVPARVKQTLKTESKGFMFLYHDDRDITDYLGELKEEGFLVNYRGWHLSRNLFLIAYIRDEAHADWLKELPAPEIPPGPRNVDRDGRKIEM